MEDFLIAAGGKVSRIGPQLLRGRGDPILRSHVEQPLTLDRNAAGLLRATVHVVLRGALVPMAGRPDPGGRSAPPDTFQTLQRPA